MNIYIDLINKLAVTSSTDPTPAVRPDIRTPISYPVNLYFLRSIAPGSGFSYVRYASAVLMLNVRSNAPVDTGRFSLTYRGAESAELDTSFNVTQIQTLLEAVPTIGVGNVKVSGDNRAGWIIEFIGILAGQSLPAMTGRVVSSTPTAVTNITVLPVDADHLNNRQLVTLRRAPLAKVTTWAETGVPATPGWTGTLDMTAVPMSVWDSPLGDIVLEVILAAANSRSGSDGVTVSDGVGRSGADGQVVVSPGITGVAKPSDNGINGFLTAADSNGVYGRRFTQGDVGRAVTDTVGYVFPGTTIVEVFDDGVINSARLSYNLAPQAVASGDYVSYTVSDTGSDVFYSATANWAAADVGHVLQATNVPTGTRIVALITNQYVRLSQRATAVGSGLTWQLLSDLSNVFTSNTASFNVADIGSRLRALTVLPNDATITDYISATQVKLSIRPSTAATGVAWTIMPARPYPAPVVSRIAIGDATAPEIQKIALAQPPIGGVLKLQDGYGGSMPEVELHPPVTAEAIKTGLSQAYQNYGDTKVVEVLPGAEWNITFGKNGAQRPLFVNETEAVYDPRLLTWIIADAVAMPTTLASGARSETPTGSPSVLVGSGLKYIGANSVTQRWQVGFKQYNKLTDGSKATTVRYKMMCFSAYPLVYNLNDGLGSGFYFTGFGGIDERYGLMTLEVNGVTMPVNRTEKHSQQRACIGVNYTSLNAQTRDIQLFSLSINTWVDVQISYALACNSFGLPNDSPAGAVLHFATIAGIESKPVLIYKNGFDPLLGTWNNKFVQSWSRRIWMGGIWEQRLLWN